MKSSARTSALTSQVGPGKLLLRACLHTEGRAKFENLPVSLRIALAIGLRPGGEAGSETNSRRQNEADRTLLDGLSGHSLALTPPRLDGVLRPNPDQKVEMQVDLATSARNEQQSRAANLQSSPRRPPRQEKVLEELDPYHPLNGPHPTD